MARRYPGTTAKTEVYVWGLRECVVCRARGDNTGDELKAQALQRVGQPAGAPMFQTAVVTLKWTMQPSFQEIQRMSQVPETIKTQKTQNGILTSQGL